MVAVCPKTIVFFTLGGLLHIPCFAALFCAGVTVSVGAHGLVLVLSHVVGGGTANTTQFPPRSLNGFGSALPTVYGPKHIAIPNQSVSVGATYNLNSDGYVPHCIHKKNSSVDHLNGYQKKSGPGIYTPAGVGHRFPGKLTSGIPFPNVLLRVLNIV